MGGFCLERPDFCLSGPHWFRVSHVSLASPESSPSLQRQGRSCVEDDPDHGFAPRAGHRWRRREGERRARVEDGHFDVDEVLATLNAARVQRRASKGVRVRAPEFIAFKLRHCARLPATTYRPFRLARKTDYRLACRSYCSNNGVRQSLRGHRDVARSVDRKADQPAPRASNLSNGLTSRRYRLTTMGDSGIEACSATRSRSVHSSGPE